MDKLIESMSNINVRKNDGYLFIKRDEIYVPIMKTILVCFLFPCNEAV